MLDQLDRALGEGDRLGVPFGRFGACQIGERPAMSTARSAGFGGSVPVNDRHGHLRAQPDARIGSTRTLKRQFAHGWVSDWSSLSAWVAWVRV